MIVHAKRKPPPLPAKDSLRAWARYTHMSNMTKCGLATNGVFGIAYVPWGTITGVTCKRCKRAR